MKINWGTGLVIVLSIFILGMGYTVYRAMGLRQDLVTTDYYQQELAYQSVIDGKRNANNLEGDCKLLVEDQKLLLQFPKGLIGLEAKLELQMYYPTMAEKDFNIDKETWTVTEKLEIPGDKISGGKWIAKVKLKVDETSYYFEPQITL